MHLNQLRQAKALGKGGRKDQPSVARPVSFQTTEVKPRGLREGKLVREKPAWALIWETVGMLGQEIASPSRENVES